MSVLLELRQKLEVLISEELGMFSNNTPAIWVEKPLIPPGLKVTGLQCVIRAVPIGRVIRMSAGQKFANYSTVVELVNFDSTTSLAAAKFKIEQTFVLTRDPEYRPATSRTLEECRFWIYTPTVYNPS